MVYILEGKREEMKVSKSIDMGEPRFIATQDKPYVGQEEV